MDQHARLDKVQQLIDHAEATNRPPVAGEPVHEVFRRQAWANYAVTSALIALAGDMLAERRADRAFAPALAAHNREAGDSIQQRREERA